MGVRADRGMDESTFETKKMHSTRTTRSRVCCTVFVARKKDGFEMGMMCASEVRPRNGSAVGWSTTQLKVSPFRTAVPFWGQTT